MAGNNTGPPRPRPITTDVDASNATPLTVPQAWALYSAVLGYHVPRHLAHAAKLNAALGQVR